LLKSKQKKLETKLISSEKFSLPRRVMCIFVMLSIKPGRFNRFFEIFEHIFLPQYLLFVYWSFDITYFKQELTTLRAKSCYRGRQ
jgi:hypothetical protein